MIGSPVISLVNSSVGIVLVHQHADLDVAGRDHLHVDAFGRRATANIRSATPVCVRMPAPTTDTLLTLPLSLSVAPQLGRDRRERLHRLLQLGVQHGEADRRLAAGADVLGDHVHGDVRGRDRGEDAMADAGPVGHAFEHQSRLVGRERGAADRELAHPLRLGDDPGALRVGARAPHHQRHVELLGELDRPRVHDARAHAGQLEHLVVADGVHLAGLGHDPRVGGVDAVHVGVDLARHFVSRPAS